MGERNQISKRQFLVSYKQNLCQDQLTKSYLELRLMVSLILVASGRIKQQIGSLSISAVYSFSPSVNDIGAVEE